MIIRPEGTDRIAVSLTPQQMGIILGLESFFTDDAVRIWLMCPSCVREHNDPSLQTDNSPSDLVWKINCRCRTRTIARSSVVTAMPPAASLLVHAPDVLKDAHLVVRCPTNHRDCRHIPLTIRPENQGWLVTCGCARRHFKKKHTQAA